jgi:hypothetical protein
LIVCHLIRHGLSILVLLNRSRTTLVAGHRCDIRGRWWRLLICSDSSGGRLVSLRHPENPTGNGDEKRRGGQGRRTQQVCEDGFLPAWRLFTGNPGAQAHFEIRRRHHRFEVADQPAHLSSLGAKLAASCADRQVRRRALTRPLTQLQFIDCSPRNTAFFAKHLYTT